MKAKVSVCFIVRDDEASGLLEACFESVRPHVEEIVVVDTGSSDATPEIAKRYADVFEVFTACNDPETGAIADFSMARNRAMALARQPWVMWMDSDDVLRGGEHISKLIEVAERNKGERDWCFLFPYEYVYDANGKCVCLHYRERLLSNRGAMRWVNPVHEVMIPADGSKLMLVPCDDVVLEHHRQRSKKPPQGGRNLRILQKLVERDGCEDARQFYYLGLEYGNAGNVEKAIEWLSKYVSVSGWEDEKTMAALKLAEIFGALGRHQESIVWAFRAVETREGWGEGYFALARGFYNLALTGVGNGKRNWEKCAHFGRLGLALPPTKTMLFVNPVERALDIHIHMTMAYSQLGDAKRALEHAEIAIKQSPNDPNLSYNLGIFRKLVARDEAKVALDKLIEAGAFDAGVRDQILAVVDGESESPLGGWPRYARPDGYPANVDERHFPVARKTPHARAFALPESVDIDDLPVRMTEAQLEAATLLVWKEYILHDEIVAAERFLADAPYRVKHSASVERALARTRAMTAWMDDSALEQKWNQPADPTVECGVVLPEPLVFAQRERSNLALSTIDKSEKILDFGCFDGAMTNRWGLAGYDVVGVDLCKSSVALANAKAEEFKTGARHICAKFSELLTAELFDVVTTCDTYEHVRDPVRDIIAPARRKLKVDGRMVLVTPHGAWMRGDFVPWAHPWRWGVDDGKVWNCDLPHAHLVAPTPWTVAENFRTDGWWVKNSYVVESRENPDVDGQGNVYAEARLLGPSCAEPLDIVFACGNAWEDWTPRVYRERGIGGSETMVVELARRLAAQGHRVRVYTSVGRWGEGVYDGVEYRLTEKTPNAESCDVLVAWRDASQLAQPVRAHARMLWVHDIFAGNAAHKYMLLADRVLGLSRWHCDFLEQHHNLPVAQIERTRNGIDLARFDEAVARNPKKIVSSSSPDRGLPVLLKVWPQIRARVPDAELHVFYGFDTWRKIATARNDEAQLRAIDQLEQRAAQLAEHGVSMRGRVDQKTLAREFLSAGVWAAPTWFTETSCITAMEAQAAGLRCVTSAIAALNETVGEDFGVLIDGDWLSDEYQKKFVDEVVRALTDPEDGWRRWGASAPITRAQIQERARRDFGLDALAAEWTTMMRDVIARLHDAPLVPYKGRADFAREAA